MKIHNISGLPTIDYRQVSPLQGNLKDLKTEQHDKLLRVLTKRGFTTPLFVWRSPAVLSDEEAEQIKPDILYLLDGHQRQRVMIKNDMHDDGNYAVPYALIPGDSLKEAKEELLEITSQYGHMTIEGLDEFAFDLDMAELDINFDAIDMDKLMDSLVEENEADDEAPEVDEVNPPVSMLGQVYQLGAHRLMCGDSTSLETVEQLMDGVKADMVFTDPPYGVSAVGGRTQVAKDKGITRIANDELTGETLSSFLTAALSNIPLKPTGSFYVCYDQRTQLEFQDTMKQIGWLQKTMIIWNKNVFGLSPKGYRPKYELVAFGHTGDSYEWYGGADQSDVWDISRPQDREGNHPTPKPVELCVRAIKNSSQRGEAIVDLFGGSGSTLIACEKLDRICYMMELDEKYVDVIRKRYAKHIGQEEAWEAATPAIEYADKH